MELVTLDAMGCQKDIVQCIVDREADDLLVLRANHDAHAAVRRRFEAHCFEPRTTIRPIFDAFDDRHGPGSVDRSSPIFGRSPWKHSRIG